jgi:flagellar protein FlaG
MDRVQEVPAVESSKITRIAKEQKVESQAKPVVNDKEVKEAVQGLNDFAQSVNRQLQFSVDEESGKTIVKVVDAETGETIRDIPPEEILRMQKQLRETTEQLFQKEEAGFSLLFQSKA